MPTRVTLIDLPLVALCRRLAGNLLIVVVLVTTAIGLTQFGELMPGASAAREFTDLPGSGVIVHSEVVGLWLPDTLVHLVRRDFPPLVALTHPELKRVLERRGNENLWYAITIRAHLADDRVEDSSLIRYPHRQPEHFLEFIDVLTTVGVSAHGHPFADDLAAIVHMIPAGMSQREWLETMQPSSLPRPAIPRDLEPKQ